MGRVRVADAGARQLAHGVAVTAVTAARWPIRRSPMTSSMRSSPGLAVSPRASGRWGCRSTPDDLGDPGSAPTSSPTRGLEEGPLGLGGGLDLGLQARDPAVLDLARLLQVALAQQPLGLDAQLVELAAQLALALEGRLLPLPAGLERAQLLLVVGEVALQRPSRSRDAGSDSFWSANSSIFSRSTCRRSRSISSGEDSISMRSREAASSMRSIALSGSWRPVM